VPSAVVKLGLAAVMLGVVSAMQYSSPVPVAHCARLACSNAARLACSKMNVKMVLQVLSVAVFCHCM
jgi:hypothetical protein